MRSWNRETPATWNADKQRIVTPLGAFPALSGARAGGLLPGEWWRVEEDGQVVAYGWMDVVWGDAQMLLAVDPARRGSGLGTWVLDQLASEAANRGLNYLFNAIPDGHPDPKGLRAWLKARSFAPSGDGLLKRKV